MRELKFWDWAKKEGLFPKSEDPSKPKEQGHLDLKKIRRRIEDRLRKDEKVIRNVPF
jgi:hypothetical protein